MTKPTVLPVPAVDRDLLDHWRSVTDDSEALIFADRLEEIGDHERAELVRLTLWLRQEMEPDGSISMHLVPQRNRRRELEARLSVWPCRECAGHTARSGTRHCPACGGSGDMLQVMQLEGPGGYSAPQPLTLRWRAGYPRYLTVPTLAELVRDECDSCGGYGQIHCRDCSGNFIWQPTPRLRALCDPERPPPWGVPLEAVMVEDREPYHNGAGWCWFDAGREYPQPGARVVPDRADLPTPLFLLLKGWIPDRTPGGRWRPYPTATLASLALGVALVALARG